MSKVRVLYVLYQYPQVSETYIRSEMEAIRDECELRVISMHRADTPYRNAEPYVLTDDVDVIRLEIAEFRPHVLHTHWLPRAREVGYLAGYFGLAAGDAAIPFTIRAHSFDVLDEDHRYVREAAPLINSDLCLGVLTFPFTRSIFERAGVRPEKLFDTWPVINYRRFHDESPNGRDVMNVGASLPKKQMEDFLELAKRVPDRRFNLYAMGYRSQEIDRRNEEMGHPVNIIPPVEPELMLPEYKKHDWLVYTASRTMGTVGWSLAVAEAQAAGVGVCFPRLRPDLEEYVGPAGYLYDSIDEVAGIISKPFPEEKRRLGFEHARKSDVFEHKKVLTGLWRKAADAPLPDMRNPAAASPDGGSNPPRWGEGDTILERKLRLRGLARQIESIVPEGAAVSVAGDVGELAETGILPGRRVLPFLERDGQFWGTPSDDKTAVAELERAREAGSAAILFTKPNFWWLEYYRQFATHLHGTYQSVVKDEQVILFDLRLQGH